MRARSSFRGETCSGKLQQDRRARVAWDLHPEEFPASFPVDHPEGDAGRLEGQPVQRRRDRGLVSRLRAVVPLGSGDPVESAGDATSALQDDFRAGSTRQPAGDRLAHEKA